MNMLWIMFGTPISAGALVIILIISYLWEKRDTVKAVVLVLGIIALLVYPFIDDSKEEAGSGSAASDVSADEIVACIDHDLDSIAALPSYRLAGRVLEGLGYEICPSYLFGEFDSRMMDGRDDMVIHGVARGSDSILRQFSMTFKGDPAVYQSVKIINSHSGKVVFSDGE